MKNQKFSSPIPFKKVGEEIRRLVKDRQKRSPQESYQEALEAVSKAHPDLYKRYVKPKKAPWIRRAAGDMDFLVQFLNSPGEGPAEMREMLVPIINWQQTPLETQELAAEKLASRLSAIDTKCYTHITNGKKPYFYWSAMGHPFYEKVARGLQTGDFWKLRQCLVCKRIFVTEDHRQRTCGKSCGEKRKNVRSTEGMSKLRAGKGEADTKELVEFIESCKRKPNILTKMSRDQVFEDTRVKFRSGIDKHWSAKRIIKTLSNKGKGWILRKKEIWMND